jgi:HlyD family secretion protein
MTVVSPLSHSTRAPGADGAATSIRGGMDRRIEVAPWRTYIKPAMAGGVGLIALIVVAAIFTTGSGRTVKVESGTVTLAKVARAAFEDFVPIRGRVTPLKTVYLDAMEGGRVEKVYVEDGADVKTGDVIVDLSNTSLQLEVLQRETEVAQQTNNMRSLELQLEKSRLDNSRDLVEAEYQIQRLTRNLERRRKLFSSGNSSESDLQSVEDEFNYQQRKHAVLMESQRNTIKLQENQLAQIKDTVGRLQQNLGLARVNLEGLKVRAPVDGRLTAFNPEVRQSLTKGERLGQVDDPAHRKIAADVDEFYLNRVALGQTAAISWSGKDYDLKVAKTYPQVRDGNFVVDLVFTGVEPTDMRRGQTLQLKLTLGDPTEALLIPDGAFFQDTGGAWLFVVAQDGKSAVRRNVRLGRRNSRFIEVLDGLQAGEQVIVSPYSTFLDKDRLQITG